jgi:hypothetical protein
MPRIERRPNASAAFPTRYSLVLLVSEIRSFWRNVMTFEAGAAEMPPIRAVFLTFPGVAKPQMCSLFVVGQMRGEFQKSEEL